MDLTDFLLARIAEDEAVARAAAPAPWEAVTDDHGRKGVEHAVWAGGAMGGYLSERIDRPSADHIARHDPARALARCAADRLIVEEFQRAWTRSQDDDPMPEGSEWLLGQRQGLLAAVQLLALPYANHPGYREEWRLEAHAR